MLTSHLYMYTVRNTATTVQTYFISALYHNYHGLFLCQEFSAHTGSLLQAGRGEAAAQAMLDHARFMVRSVEV